MIQKEVYAIGATRINVGLSAIIKIGGSTLMANQFLQKFKIFSGGGTLEICPVPIALSGTSCAPWGTGYPVGAAESIDINAFWPGPSVTYLCATGATMVVAAHFAYTSGFSLTV